MGQLIVPRPFNVEVDIRISISNVANKDSPIILQILSCIMDTASIINQYNTIHLKKYLCYNQYIADLTRYSDTNYTCKISDQFKSAKKTISPGRFYFES